MGEQKIKIYLIYRAMVKLRKKKSTKEKYFVIGDKKYEFHINDGVITSSKYKSEIYIEKDCFGFFNLSVKNNKYHADIIERKDNKYIVEVNGNSYHFSIESPFSLKRMKILEKKKGKVNTLHVQAPMPGKIIDVLVEEGANIQQGEPILILEAMKMQNEILADNDGKIDKIFVKPETSVMKDDILVEISLS